MPDLKKQYTVEGMDTGAAVNATINASAELSAALPRIPVLTGENVVDVERQLRYVGDVLASQPRLRNEWDETLWNQIGAIVFGRHEFRNPYYRFNRGRLRAGEIVQEVVREMSLPNRYNPARAENEVYKRVRPRTKTAYYVTNAKLFYKETNQEYDIRMAFSSVDGYSRYVEQITDAMIAGYEHDYFLIMKYIMGRAACDGFIYNQEIQDITIDNATTEDVERVVARIKSFSDKFEFNKAKYNKARYKHSTPKRLQNLMYTTDSSAIIDVFNTSSAYNKEYVAFLGKRLMIDSFADYDEDDYVRLGIILGNDDDPTQPTIPVVPFTPAEITYLESIEAMLFDDRIWIIFDWLEENRAKENEEGLYTNMWHHIQRMFGVSPFYNWVMFTSTASAISAVTVTPATASLPAGSTLKMQYTATKTGFPQFIESWSATGDVNGFEIDPDGVITIKQNATAKDGVATTADVTVTLVLEDQSGNTATGTATITVTGLVEAGA